jgi:protein subunit release factor B
MTKIKVERLRKGGPGGQNRNKRETAIRMTDEATGIAVTIVRERSQAQNLAVAEKILKERLANARRKPKRRKPTRPGKAAQARRLDAKRRESAKKRDRSRGRWD